MDDPFRRLMGFASDWQVSVILIAGCELDLFTRLIHDGPANAATLAEDLDCDRRGMAALVGALTAAGFLVPANEGGTAVVTEGGTAGLADRNVAVAPEYLPFLDSKNEETLVPIIRHWGACLRSWSQLSFTVKGGFPFPRQASILGPLGDYQSFILGMDSIARRIAGPLAIKMKEAGILNFRRMLDLGGASGTYSRAFLEANPEGTAVIFDLPIAIDEAKKKVISSPWRDRIELVAGNFYQSDFPDGVDFVWISAIIHSESVEETRTLFRKSRLALLDGGMIAIRDFFPQVGRIPPLPASLFNVNMLMNSEKGKVYGREEVFDLLTETGFRNPRLAIPSEGMDAVIVAEK